MESQINMDSVNSDQSFGRALARGPVSPLIRLNDCLPASESSEYGITAANRIRYAWYLEQLSRLGLNPLEIAFRVQAGLNLQSRLTKITTILIEQRMTARLQAAKFKAHDRSGVQRLKLVVK